MVFFILKRVLIKRITKIYKYYYIHPHKVLIAIRKSTPGKPILMIWWFYKKHKIVFVVILLTLNLMVTNGIDKKRNQRILKHENNQNQTSLSPSLSHKIWPDIKRQPQNYMIVCKEMRIKHPRRFYANRSQYEWLVCAKFRIPIKEDKRILVESLRIL